MIRDIRAHLRDLITEAERLDGTLAGMDADGLPPMVAARALLGVVDLGDRLFTLAEPVRKWRGHKRKSGSPVKASGRG